MAEMKIEDFSRMCNFYRGHGKGGECQNCPLYTVVLPGSCHLFLCEHTAEADSIIDKWCKKHPKKTYAQDFLEKFPDAPKNHEGLPVASACDIYGEKEYFVKYCANYDSCSKCWEEVIPDE